MRKVLRMPVFRLLFTGLVFAMTAESVLILALAIWVKDLTGSDGLAGAAILAVVAPFTFAPLVGVFVDRYRRKPFLVAALVSSAIALTPLFAIGDRGQLWIIYAVAFCYGLSFIAVSAALNGLIQEVIPADYLAEANGALQTVRQGLRLVAPLAGAGLYAATGGWGLPVAGITGFLIAAGVLQLLTVAETAPQPVRLTWLGEVGAGMRHLFATASLRRALLGSLIAVLVYGFGESLFFAFVDRGLHQPPTFLGVLISAQGVGGLLGGLTAAFVLRRLGEIGAIAFGTIVSVPMMLTAIVPRMWLAFPMVVLAGFGLPYAIVGLNTLLQKATPPELIGRVSAALEALTSGPQALFIALGAVAVGLVDFRLIFAVMAVLMTTAAVYLWAGRALTPPSRATGTAMPASTLPSSSADPAVTADPAGVADPAGTPAAAANAPAG